eukprot:symbB.v1.2.015189.t2/scaffold1044.1/size142232/10
MLSSRGVSMPPIVGFIDMDCFYVAVERARDKRLHGKPCAVVQYPTGQRGRRDLRPEDDRWRTGGAMGGIIAVSYEARAKGVMRQMSGHEAMKVCPEIILVQVPTAFGKADLQIYKEAGDAVVELLAQRCDATEKRSVDEVAIDVTSEAQRLLSQQSFEELRGLAQKASHLADSALSKAAANVTRSEARQGHQKQQTRNMSALADGWEEVFHRFSSDLTVQRLIAGAVVVKDLRAEVESVLGFTCSGGVATNKILAKLGCGLHKPNQQDLPLDRLPGLGGDFGQAVKTRLEVETAGQVLQVPREVMKHFPQKGEWLLALAAGEDSAAEAVKDRQLVKSLSNGKTFFGDKRLRSLAEVDYWLGELSGELHRRYQKQVGLIVCAMEMTEMQIQRYNLVVNAVLSCATLCLSVMRRRQLCQLWQSAHASLLSLCCKSRLSNLDHQAQDAFCLELSQIFLRAVHGLAFVLFCRSLLVVVGMEHWLAVFPGRMEHFVFHLDHASISIGPGHHRLLATCGLHAGEHPYEDSCVCYCASWCHSGSFEFDIPHYCHNSIVAIQ